MARQPIAGRDEAIEAIRQHLATKGRGGLMELRAEGWPHVAPGTWYDWCGRAKRNEPTPQALADARRLVASAINNPDVLDQAVRDALPAIPAPSAISSMGPGETRRSLNLFVRWEQLWSDCEMVRAYAVKAGDNGETIKLLKAFMHSISMRGHILRNLMEALGQLWNIKRMQDFQDTVVNEIGQESPECAARIMARLSSMSDDCAMTMDARV